MYQCFKEYSTVENLATKSRNQHYTFLRETRAKALLNFDKDGKKSEAHCLFTSVYINDSDLINRNQPLVPNNTRPFRKAIRNHISPSSTADMENNQNSSGLPQQQLPQQQFPQQLQMPPPSYVWTMTSAPNQQPFVPMQFAQPPPASSQFSAPQQPTPQFIAPQAQFVAAPAPTNSNNIPINGNGNANNNPNNANAAHGNFRGSNFNISAPNSHQQQIRPQQQQRNPNRGNNTLNEPTVRALLTDLVHYQRQTVQAIDELHGGLEKATKTTIDAIEVISQQCAAILANTERINGPNGDNNNGTNGQPANGGQGVQNGNDNNNGPNANGGANNMDQ